MGAAGWDAGGLAAVVGVALGVAAAAGTFAAVLGVGLGAADAMVAGNTLAPMVTQLAMAVAATHFFWNTLNIFCAFSWGQYCQTTSDRVESSDPT
ncbi:MAG: hypothetical protein ACOYKK_01045 [Microbacteriaceae bacterium]